MSEIKLGNKYDCFNCGTKFYDLGKGAALCPKCGADQKDATDKAGAMVAQSVKRRRRAELTTTEEAPATEAAAPIADDEELVDDDLELVADVEEEEEDDEEV